MSDWATPAQMAHFDQARAEADECLDWLIKAHREQLTEEPIEMSLAGMAQYLFKESDAQTMAQVLAVAVHRLAGVVDSE